MAFIRFCIADGTMIADKEYIHEPKYKCDTDGMRPALAQ